MSSEKRRAESPEPLEQEKRRLNDSIRITKKRLKAHGSFNAKFWADSEHVGILILKR
jgi:hypothetical protein